MRFWDRFPSKNQWFLQSKLYLLPHTSKKGCFLLVKPSIFRWKSIPKSHEESVKNYKNFNLCWKCIIWCWWAWRVYGNVSRVLQTRKTIKIAWCFRKFHYNRDSNTNGHPLPSIIAASFWTTSQTLTPSELTSRQIKIESNRSNPSRPPVSSQTYSENSFWEPKQSV